MKLFRKSEKKNDNPPRNLIIKVSGMHCQGCSQNIEKTLSKIKSIRNVKAKFENEEVSILFDDDEKRENIEQIRHAIRKAGFIPGVERAD